jgi:glycerophosphoryl diester phosphodiesterase
MPGKGNVFHAFTEAAALCRELGLLANVEIKPTVGQEIETAECVAKLTALSYGKARLCSH